MYKTVCLTCNTIYSHKDDLCPECGSYHTDEFHLLECDCDQCVQGKRDVFKNMFNIMRDKMHKMRNSYIDKNEKYV